jgi:drug/metabolite transporter (DMT)-like permease
LAGGSRGLGDVYKRQLLTLVAVTLMWGMNWPIMKLGTMGMPPLSFRALSMWLSLPVIMATLMVLKTPWRVPRAQWPELLKITVFNMMVWHGLMILAVKSLSSGRAAILGYSMPIFSAVLGSMLFGAALSKRAWGGVVAAGVGVMLLLWHEFINLSGNPLAVGMALVSALSWALGIQLLRRTTLTVPTLNMSFWMTLLTVVLMTCLATFFEHQDWAMPSPTTWGAIVYNALLIFGCAQILWLWLARHLTPVASTLSVMMIPVIGVFSGALWLGEILHWQDWAAVGLMVLAIASVLWPSRQA